MQTKHAADTQWSVVSGHRSGGIEFKRLLQGADGSPDNYELSIVKTGGDYFTPRHHHNFDQVRLCLEGAMNYAPGKDLKSGTVGYFPEGTFYGPQANTAKSVVLLIQMGGAAGYGFMSYQLLNAGYEKMCDLGQFDRGVFTRRLPDGRVTRKDGYEAIWEHVNGREVEYPPPRYEEPVIMHPANFQWRPTRDPGFALKHLGTFGERGVAIGQISGTRGARHLVDEHKSPELLFVAKGAIRDVGTNEVLEAQSAFRVDPADTGREFEVVEDCELFFVQIPYFGAQPIAGAAY
jgi:quercetin dioxygenase-like cupin family protein